jgi:hypothetical protein
MNLKRIILGLVALAASLCGFSDARAGTFNGFEGVPLAGPYLAGSPLYTEGGITVEQVTPDPDDNVIWVTFFHPELKYGWYPDGGDFGYTKITLSGGGDFSDVFLKVSTGEPTPDINGDPSTPGSSGSTLLYELLKGGSVVLAGFGPALTQGTTTDISFLGGGFDEIRIRDTTASDPGSQAFLDPSDLNALAIDAIENRATGVVPEPASLTLWGIGAVGLIGYCGRLRRKNPANAV